MKIKRLLLRQSESIHLCLDGSILCYACTFQPEGRVRRIWPSSVRRSASKLTIVCLRCMVHISYILKDLSGLLPALSSRGGFRREGATNRGPSFLVPSLAWYMWTSATLVSFILFKLVLSVKDCFLRCKCGRESMGSHRCRNSCTKAKQLQSEYGHVVIMTAYSFSFSSLFGQIISSLQ